MPQAAKSITIEKMTEFLTSDDFEPALEWCSSISANEINDSVNLIQKGARVLWMVKNKGKYNDDDKWRVIPRIITMVTKLNDIGRVLDSTESIKNEMRELKEEINNMKNLPCQVSGGTFADAVKRKMAAQPVVKRFDRKRLVFVKKEINGKSLPGKELASIVEKELKKELDVKISSVKTLSNSYMITAANEMEANKVEERLTKKLKDTSIERARPRQPRLIIGGIDATNLSDDELMDEIIKKNEFENERNNIKLLKAYELKTQNDNRITRKTIVLSVPANIRKKIGNDGGRIFCGLQTYRAKDTFQTDQCFKCYKFGHSAKNCANDEKCKNCGEGHKQPCPNLNSKKCINCGKQHSSTSLECEIVQEAITRASTRVDFDYREFLV